MAGTGTIKCWKCKRVRKEKFMNLSRKQCKARAVCKNIRNRRRREAVNDRDSSKG